MKTTTQNLATSRVLRIDQGKEAARAFVARRLAWEARLAVLAQRKRDCDTGDVDTRRI
jgi:hypothetical protein